MHADRPGEGARTGYLPQMLAATLAVAVLPGFLAGALQGVGLIDWWWLSFGIAVALSILAAAAGASIWARRPAARDIVFSDLMIWGWLRRWRTERRLASTQWLLGGADLDPARQVALLERLSAALEARNPYVHGHSKRVARHAYMIARQLGLPEEDVARIRTAAALHDVGKIETPREVLNKPGRLTEAEFATIKRHAARGAEMVAPVGDDDLTSIVRHHHERLDGGGYPDGLRGGDIPLGARVIAVADTFDAMTSERPYRAARPHKEALDVLRLEAGAQLDPDVVSNFLAYYGDRHSLPWWGAVAAVPLRLAVWAVSGAQGAAAAQLGGALAALGTTFLVGGALGGATVAGDAPRSVAPAAIRLADVSESSTSRVTHTRKRREEATRRAERSTDRATHLRKGAPSAAPGPTGDHLSTRKPAAPGTTGASGSKGSSGTVGPLHLSPGTLPEAPKVLRVPDVPVPAVPQLPTVTPPVALPGLPQAPGVHLP